MHMGTQPCSPRLWGFTLNSKELRPALTAEPHGHFNKKDYLAPGTILQPTASPEGAEESAGEKRRRGATDNRADTSPLLWKIFPVRGTWETQRVSAVPPATDLRAGPRATVHGGHGAATWPVLRGESGARSACPRPQVRTRLPTAARSVNTRRPPPPRLRWDAGGGAQRPRGPPFLRLSSGSGGKARRAKGREDAAAVCGEGRRRARECAAGRAARASAAPARLPAGVAPKTRTTGTFLTGAWVRGDWQISSPCSGLAM